MRRRAERGGIHRRVRMRSVGADSDMNGNRHAFAPCLHQQARRGMLVRRKAAQSPAERFAQPAIARKRRVPLPPGFFRRAEAPVRQHRFHVLTGVARKCNLKIVDRGGPVHGKTGREPAPHQIDQHRRQTTFNDVAAHPPDHRLALPASLRDRRDHGPERIARQNPRQAVEPTG